MAEKANLPKTTDEIPHDLKYDCNKQSNYMRNAFVGELSEFESVEIVYNQDSCECDDDSHGIWSISAYKQGRQFEASDADFINALWFVIEHARAKDNEDYERFERAKAKALSKLSSDDKKILGIRY